jgi:hypothetical protein
MLAAFAAASAQVLPQGHDQGRWARRVQPDAITTFAASRSALSDKGGSAHACKARSTACR